MPKKIAIMQPYFFPYLGYFSLIKNTDEFILFDPVQFIRHGWIERNRVLKPGNGWQYIAVPLEKHGMHTTIQDVKIRHSEPWREKLYAQLEHYKKKSPFYNETMSVVQEATSFPPNSITELNQKILKTVCDYLGIPFKSQIFSQMHLNIEPVFNADEWALNICKAMGYEEYWNPPGGIEFFDRSKYERAGIKLVFQKPILSSYSQRRGPENFEAGLSIIDVMMFNPPEKIREMLNEYKLI